VAAAVDDATSAASSQINAACGAIMYGGRETRSLAVRDATLCVTWPKRLKHLSIPYRAERY